jgi:hypothetical protein
MESKESLGAILLRILLEAIITEKQKQQQQQQKPLSGVGRRNPAQQNNKQDRAALLRLRRH